MSTSPALVLMDLGLPVLDGWEATRRIKADPQHETFPCWRSRAMALPTPCAGQRRRHRCLLHEALHPGDCAGEGQRDARPSKLRTRPGRVHGIPLPAPVYSLARAALVPTMVIWHGDGRFTRLEGEPCEEYAAALAAATFVHPTATLVRLIGPVPTEMDLRPPLAAANRGMFR